MMRIVPDKNRRIKLNMTFNLLLNKAKDKLCETYIRDAEKAIQTAQETIAHKTDEVKAKVTNATAKSIIESFKTPTFPAAIDRLMAEFQRIDAGVDNGLLSGAAKGAHRVEYEQKTRTEYRDATRQVKRTGTREREASGIWENIRAFFGKTYCKAEEEPNCIQKTVTDTKEYKVSVDVYDVQGFKDYIENQMQSRITKALENAQDKMDSAVKDELRKFFSNVQAQCDQIGVSYERLSAILKKILTWRPTRPMRTVKLSNATLKLSTQ